MATLPVLVVVAGQGRWLGPVARPFAALVVSRLWRQRMLPFLAKPSQQDLIVLKELIEAKKLTPVIDRVYSLAETPDAMRYLETGHARGKVIITV